MLSCTLQEYKDSYEANLSAYLLEYEDNTQTSFLEIELNIHKNYYNSLVKISDYFKNNTSKDLRINSAIRSVISDLKNINEQVFNEIFTIGKTKIATERVTMENGFEDELILGSIQPSIDINFKKLKNRITSAKRIMEFISEQLTISLSSNENATSLYLTGELPQGTAEQQSLVPSEEMVVVKAEIKVNSENTEVNDYTKSSIEDYLADIVDDIKPDDYKLLTDALYSYFTTGKFPTLNRKILFKRVNKKKVGWALKELYKSKKIDVIPYEYLLFAKENINLFENDNLSKVDFKTCNLYKYFTTNPTN